MHHNSHHDCELDRLTHNVALINATKYLILLGPPTRSDVYLYAPSLPAYMAGRTRKNYIPSKIEPGQDKLSMLTNIGFTVGPNAVVV